MVISTAPPKSVTPKLRVQSSSGGAKTLDDGQLDGMTASLALGNAAPKNKQPSVLTLGKRERRACAWPPSEAVWLVVIAGTTSVKCADL
jgi:hypothetical protein